MNRSSAANLFDQLPHGYRMDRRIGPVYDHPPSGADDLTIVRGIDTREAVILNRLGVYFLAQIALWQHPEIGAVADEVGTTASALTKEQWVEQAQSICRPRPVEPTSMAPHLPASLVRTVTLLGCALLIGCMVVYWLSLRNNSPMRGVLSADITSLRVPAESRLITSHVQPGQEVFSGEPLLTLEKTEHVAMINLQESRVIDLKRQLDQAEARAALDLVWRTRELERELSDVRTRAHLIQEVKTLTPPNIRSASRPSPIRQIDGVLNTLPQTVSQSRTVARPELSPRRKTPRPNGMVFIGASGEATINVPRSTPMPVAPPIVHVAPEQLVLASEPRVDGMLHVEAQSVEARLHRLETLRDKLPQQVRRAAGVESIRVQHDEASQRLKEMQTLSREIAVICPRYGKVGQIRYQPGDTMTNGEIMLKILHPDRRYVILNVPTRRVNEIQPGTIVDLVFPGDQYFRGKVANLPMLAETVIPGGQSLVTVRVEPTGRLWPEIPVGSQIDVLINERG